jgi:hypothetical protein
VATDLLARIRGELEERIVQLRPLLSEYERLSAALETLASVEAEPAAPEGPSAPPAAPAERAPSAAASRRGRPPRGSAAGAFGLAISLRTTPLIEPARPKRTFAKLHERPAPPAGAAERNGQAAPPPAEEDSEPRRKPASPAAVQQAILAALEHGSHTASELVTVTAMSAREIRGGLGRLAARGTIAKVRRGDGKSAYALPSVSAHS